MGNFEGKSGKSVYVSEKHLEHTEAGLAHHAAGEAAGFCKLGMFLLPNDSSWDYKELATLCL